MFGDKLQKIEKLAEKKKSDALCEYVNDKREDVCLAAVAALGKCGDDSAYNALIPLIHHASPAIRAAVVAALGAVGRPSARAHIEHQMNRETDSKVLAAMNGALHKLHGETE